jgi:hypothetical protein
VHYLREHDDSYALILSSFPRLSTFQSLFDTQYLLLSDDVPLI